MRVLAIVDENLELDDASVTISGSHAIARAREKLTRAEEARLLVLIRSANDSAHDVAMYRERAHGFLSKAPSEPDWKLIKRQYFHRFGVDRNPAVEETSFESDSIAEMSMKAASAELRKVRAARPHAPAHMRPRTCAHAHAPATDAPSPECDRAQGAPGRAPSREPERQEATPTADGGGCRAAVGPQGCPLS